MTFVWCWVLANQPLGESGAWHPHKYIWTDIVFSCCFYVSSIIIAYLESRKRENSYHSNKFGQFDTTNFKVHYAIIGMSLGSWNALEIVEARTMDI